MRSESSAVKSQLETAAPFCIALLSGDLGRTSTVHQLRAERQPTGCQKLLNGQVQELVAQFLALVNSLKGVIRLSKLHSMLRSLQSRNTASNSSMLNTILSATRPSYANTLSALSC